MAKQELTINKSASVGTTNTEISPECFQQRSCIIITNTSAAAIISISIGEEAVAGEGIQLSPGGVYQDSRDGQYMPSNKQINAIASIAGGTVAIHERIIMDQMRGW